MHTVQEELTITNNKCLVIYHRVDYDGLFSAKIAFDYFNNIGWQIDMLGYNYNDEIEFPSFEAYNAIIMVDIVLPVQIMKSLRAEFYDKTIWIDHHVTAINNSVSEGYNDLKGVRSIDKAACMLTYEYFISEPSEEAPLAIRLIGANDIWDHKTFDWNKVVAPFQLGLRTAIDMDFNLLNKEYYDIINFTDRYIHDGVCIKSYIDNMQKTWCERFAFDVKVNGCLKGVAMICPTFSSNVFNSIINNYDCCVVVEKNGSDDDKYNVSIYTEHADDLGFSAGEYMKENYQGGGHAGAAGGILTKDQFIKLITEHII